jgi:hypothetical protein
MGSRGHCQAVRNLRASPIVIDTQRGAQCHSLTLGQCCQVAGYRIQQRIQAREAQSAFGFDPRSLQDSHRPGPAGGIIDQRCFPDTWIAA